MQKYFFNLFVINCIFSIVLLPVIIYLSKNKQKINPKIIYKIEVTMCILLFIPLVRVNWDNNLWQIKNNILEEKKYEISSKNNLKDNFEKAVSYENINDIKNDSDEEKHTDIIIDNNSIYNVYRVLPIMWVIIEIILLVYYFIVHKKYVKYLNLYFEDNREIGEIINKYKSKMKIKKKISFAFSSQITSPITIGITKKIIVIPKEYEIKDYEFILKHEVFHVKNNDIELKLFCLITEIIYFFNPIVRLLEKEITEIIEINCDYNILLDANEAERQEYGNILLKQIEKNRKNKYKLATSFAYSKRRSIMNRFSNIINGKNKKRGIIIIAVVFLLIMGAVVAMVSMPNIAVTYAKNTEENVEKNSNIKEMENTQDEKNKIEETAVKTETAKNTEEIKKDNKEEIANKEIVEKNNAKNTNEKNDSKLKFSKPLKDNYIISTKYSSNHNGTDFAAQEGTNIYASAAGTVIKSEYQKEYGNVIVIDHGNGTTTLYACCSKLLKKVGDIVTENDIIALVGSTGNSTGPHLHFGIKVNGENQNPEKYL